MSSGQALACGIEIATQIAALPPLAVQAAREVMRLGADVPLKTALALERRFFERLSIRTIRRKACARSSKSGRQSTRVVRPAANDSPAGFVRDASSHGRFKADSKQSATIEL